MLMNNLDPEVAENPDELVVYGGIGRAARNWECFDRIVETLRALERRRNAADPVRQAGRCVPHARRRAARAARQLESGAEVVDVGALQRARPPRPDDVRPDDRRFVDLHRQPGHRAGHARDVRRDGSAPLRRRSQGQVDSHRRARRHGRRAAARGDDGGREHPVHRMPAESHPEAARHALPRRAGAVARCSAEDDRRRDGRAPRDLRRRARQRSRARARARSPRHSSGRSHRPDFRARSRQRLPADRLDASSKWLEMRTRDPAAVTAAAQRSAAVHVKAMLDYHAMGVPTFDYGNNIRQVALRRRREERVRISPASCRRTFVRCSVAASVRSAGSRCPAIRKTSIAPTRR